ncbi:MAG: DUF6054 family protein [Tissierellaceae bacterium]
MSKYSFSVNISPVEALNIVKRNQNADLLHEETIDLGDGRSVCILVFEKYYFRAENRAALTVIIDNTKGKTNVKSIAAGSSKGLLFGFDWGAGDDFAYSIKSMLEKYTI